MSPMKMTAKRLRRKRICSLRWQTRSMNAVAIVEDVRLQMDTIDRDAHEAIQKIIDSKRRLVRPIGDAVDDLGDSRSGSNFRRSSFRRGLGEDRLAGHANSISHRALTGRQSGTDRCKRRPTARIARDISLWRAMDRRKTLPAQGPALDRVSTLVSNLRRSMVTEGPNPVPLLHRDPMSEAICRTKSRSLRCSRYPRTAYGEDLTQVGFLALLRPPRNKLNRAPPASCPP